MSEEFQTLTACSPPSKFNYARFLEYIERVAGRIEASREPGIIQNLVKAMTSPRMVGKARFFPDDEEVIGLFDYAMASASDAKTKDAWHEMRDLFLKLGDGNVTTDRFAEMIRQRVQTIRAKSHKSGAMLRTVTDDPKPTQAAQLAKKVPMKGRGLSKEAKAVAALVDNPGWTDAQIAEAAGCHVKSLYRFQNFVRARDAQELGRLEVIRGTKYGTEGIERAVKVTSHRERASRREE
jgi:hypothetical protein